MSSDDDARSHGNGGGNDKAGGGDEYQGPKDQVPVVVGPSTIMSPKHFAEWMTFAISSDFLNDDRAALLKRMSEDLIRDPALLRHIERILTEYSDEIRRVSPNDAELERYSFSWVGTDQSQALVPPAAAAAALAPPAAALAAAHTPSG